MNDMRTWGTLQSVENYLSDHTTFCHTGRKGLSQRSRYSSVSFHRWQGSTENVPEQELDGPEHVCKEYLNAKLGHADTSTTYVSFGTASNVLKNDTQPGR
jgi:hypothetical protein